MKNEAYYFKSGEDGAAKAGRVDNGNLNLSAAYTLGANTFSLGYMQLRGNTGMPYLASIGPYVMVVGALATDLNPRNVCGSSSTTMTSLGFRIRHAHYQNNFSRDVEQTRVNIDYTLALW